MKAQVGIIMGSKSDLSVMNQAAEVLKELGVEFELTIVSAHRTPHRMVEYCRKCQIKRVKGDYCWCWRSGSLAWNGRIINYPSSDRSTCQVE